MAVNRQRKSYLSPRLIDSLQLFLERELLTASVVDQVSPVETAGQSIDGIYDGGEKASPSATFNYDWED